MDHPLEYEGNSIERLLDDGNFQHHLVGSAVSQKQDPSQVLKDIPEKERKKGRPKGLKTSKSKSQHKEQSNSQKNKGHWLTEQNKRYHWFLEIHSKHFVMKKLRRMDKIFKSMADFIGSREAEQCRSHHQKMEKKFKSFYKILKNLRLDFYMSADPSYVKSDFQNHNISEYDPLISQLTLEDQNKDAQGDASQQLEYRQDLQLQGHRNQNQHKILMSDHYEKQFRL